MTDSISFEDFLGQQLEDVDFREDWERTALARSVADQVIRYRIEHSLSQRALADRLGVSQAVVGRLELGEHEPKISTLSRLVQKLGLRFSIEIHPVNASNANQDVTVTRLQTGGVELVVAAS
jgi:ribosome-binding protein aMBF1 (putative translation factor)